MLVLLLGCKSEPDKERKSIVFEYYKNNEKASKARYDSLRRIDSLAEISRKVDEKIKGDIHDEAKEICFSILNSKRAKNMFGYTLFTTTVNNTKREVNISDRENILKKNPYISVYSGGKKIGLLEYQDNPNSYEILFKIIELDKEYARGYNLYASKRQEFIGIGSTNSSLSSNKFLRGEPNNSEIKKALELTNKLFISSVEGLFKKDSIKVVRLDVINLPENIHPIYICTSTLNVKNKDTIDYYTLFFIVSEEGENNGVKFHKITHCNSMDDKRCEYYEFLDVFDYDHDGLYEIFYVNNGYENQDAVVLKNIDGNWQEVQRINSWSL